MLIWLRAASSARHAQEFCKYTTEYVTVNRERIEEAISVRCASSRLNFDFDLQNEHKAQIAVMDTRERVPQKTDSERSLNWKLLSIHDTFKLGCYHIMCLRYK